MTTPQRITRRKEMTDLNPFTKRERDRLTLPDTKEVQRALDRLLAQRGRLLKLQDAYRCRAAGPEALPHGFARYIATLSSGYLMGENVQYECADPDALKAFTALNARACPDELDGALALDQAVYGRAMSLCYLAADGKPRLRALPPQNALILRGDTIEQEALMGLYLAQGRDAAALYVYTPSLCLCYPLSGQRLAGPPTVKPHGLGALPMSEYLNNQETMGDFESVLPLIAAYERLAEDRVRDRQQFADALLVLTGVMSVEPEDGVTPLAQRLKAQRTLALPDSEAKAEWLVKTPVEADIDVLRHALSQDIHKFAMTPDLGDERFLGNLSGVAVKYRLFCLEQRVKIKERYFLNGLRHRAGLLAGYLSAQKLPAPDPAALTIRLKRRLPFNHLERAQTLRQLTDIVSPQQMAEAALETTRFDG